MAGGQSVELPDSCCAAGTCGRIGQHQDLRADCAHWIAAAIARGPGWRVWRWEEVFSERAWIIWHHRLLAPGEWPNGEGAILGPDEFD